MRLPHLCAGPKLAAAQAGHRWAHCCRSLQQLGAQETSGSGVPYGTRPQSQQRAEKDDRGHRRGPEAMRAPKGHQGHGGLRGRTRNVCPLATS